METEELFVLCTDERKIKVPQIVIDSSQFFQIYKETSKYTDYKEKLDSKTVTFS